MAFTQISPNTSRDGDKLIITAGATHCRIADAWRLIDEVLSVDCVAGVFTVRVEGVGSMTWRPRVKHPDAFVDRVVGKDHFGDFVNADKIDDDIFYDVDYDCDVDILPEGYVFTECPQLGLLLRELLNEFPGRVTVAPHEVKIDTRGLTGILNLDPETQHDPSAVDRFAVFGQPSGDWNTATGPASGLTGLPGNLAKANNFMWHLADNAGNIAIERSRATFDVSAITDPVSAVDLRLTSQGSFWTPAAGMTIQAYQKTVDYSGLSNNDGWDDFLAAAGNTEIGSKDISEVPISTEFRITLNDAVLDISGNSTVYIYTMTNWDFSRSIPNSLNSSTRTEGLAAAEAVRPALMVTLATFPNVGGHRFYRGTTPSNVDYDTPVASVVMDGDEATIVGLGHDPSRAYYYVCRPETPSGLVTPDISNIVRLDIGADGEWLGAIPAAVASMNVTPRPAAVLRVRWRYDEARSPTVPTRFFLWRDTDLATLGDAGPNAVVEYDGARWHTHDFSLADGVNYWVLIKAATEASIVVSDGVVVGPTRADATAPDSPAVTVTTGF